MHFSDESFDRLKRAGWSVGDVRIVTPTGLAWLVTGANGENVIEARGATQAEAWHQACEQAQGLGMLGRNNGDSSRARKSSAGPLPRNRTSYVRYHGWMRLWFHTSSKPRSHPW